MADAHPSPASTVVVAGPTASGKSALALRLAEALGGMIINADSMQVYRELRVLTARPSAEEEARVPHRLYGVMSAADPCSVGRWLDLVENTLAEARSAGLLPILVGGTGMYLHALTHGLAEMPPVPQRVRAETQALHDRIGGEAFRERLAALDPAAAARIATADRQRLLRAWEVVTATGRPLSAWQADAPARRLDLGRIAAVIVMPSRSDLYAACDARFDRMMAHGAVTEVARLLDLRLSPSLPAMRALGVPHLARHLRGELSLEDAVAASKQASRNYVKRQITWLRHHKISDQTILTKFPERELGEILSFIRQFLLTSPD